MEEFFQKMSEFGYKQTKPRLAVLNVLHDASTPLSAGEVHKLTSRINQASIYRALNLFESIDLIKSMTVGKKKVYCAGRPHHHVICKKCGRVESFPCEHNFKKCKDFTVFEHELTLYGVCAECGG